MAEPHLAQPMQQSSRILQHHPRSLAFLDQFGDELAHALVAPMKNWRVVVVADPGVVHIMCFRLLMISALTNSWPPAGMSG